MKKDAVFEKLGLVVLFVLAGCASTQRIYRPELSDRTQLFPDALYRSHLRIELPPSTSYHFRGVVRLAKDKIVVVGYGPLSTALFRITDGRAAEAPKIEILQSQLKPHLTKIADFYSVLRKALMLPVSVAKTTPVEANGKTAQLTLLDRDVNQIPEKMRIAYSGWSAEVEIESYEF